MAKVYPSRADNRLLSDSFLINDESIGRVEQGQEVAK